mgnify:CR=1 FL=1
MMVSISQRAIKLWKDLDVSVIEFDKNMMNLDVYSK